MLVKTKGKFENVKGVLSGSFRFILRNLYSLTSFRFFTGYGIRTVFLNKFLIPPQNRIRFQLVAGTSVTPRHIENKLIATVTNNFFGKNCPCIDNIVISRPK